MNKPKQRADGRWYQVLELLPTDGTRRRKMFTGDTPAEVKAEVGAFKRDAEREMMVKLERWRNQYGNTRQMSRSEP